jgi:hypothetical protein
MTNVRDKLYLYQGFDITWGKGPHRVHTLNSYLEYPEAHQCLVHCACTGGDWGSGKVAKDNVVFVTKVGYITDPNYLFLEGQLEPFQLEGEIGVFQGIHKSVQIRKNLTESWAQFPEHLHRAVILNGFQI